MIYDLQQTKKLYGKRHSSTIIAGRLSIDRTEAKRDDNNKKDQQ